ncbi:unnamed protein product [Nippostrongylus brasiliensis]|uniref:Condensin-2 complex subunit G2 (inferred by orthology to a human protein) n=1 Tax=Nippostrongylus brasiliensis TaxID=27835 RepID=A0A0N4YZ06_NIPBR|nr:unnamed protein product [Nippostrongylus brasiliensis]
MAGKRRTLKRSTAPLEPLLEETDSGQNSSQAAEAPLKDLQAEVEAPQFDENEKENSRADNRASLKVVSRKVVTKLEVEATKKKSVNEKVALILSDYPDLLEKACKNEKGQAPQFDENEKENSRADNRASLKVVSRKVVTKLEVEATKKKLVNEKVALILSDYPDLLEKACKNEKGQKMLIKRLWADHEEVVEQCDVNLLRHSLWEPSFIGTSDGVKFCAFALRKIGFREALLLMKKMVVSGATNATCNNLGKIIYTAWRIAAREEDEDMMKAIENEMITGVVHSAVLLPINLSAKFVHVSLILLQFS